MIVTFYYVFKCHKIQLKRIHWNINTEPHLEVFVLSSVKHVLVALKGAWIARAPVISSVTCVWVLRVSEVIKREKLKVLASMGQMTNA